MHRPEIDPAVKNNYYLGGKNCGACRALRGKVGIFTCFLITDPADFSEKTRQQYYGVMNEAVRWLETEAKKRGASLELVPYQFTIETGPLKPGWLGFHTIKNYFNATSMEALQKHYEQKMGLDDVVFLLAVDKQDRSYAYQQERGTPVNECSTIFRDRNGYHMFTIIHELLHQFGAADLYFPDRVHTVARRCGLAGVMTGESFAMDDLTAYLVGWSDTVSHKAYQFLKETMWVTKELRTKSLSEQWR